jgi:hypothetical protein
MQGEEMRWFHVSLRAPDLCLSRPLHRDKLLHGVSPVQINAPLEQQVAALRSPKWPCDNRLTS